SEAGRATDVLTQAFSSSNTNLEQLGQAMKYVGPIASAAGVSFEETAAAIGLLGNAGIQASMAGTTLRAAISALLNPTKTTRDTMAELGLTLADFQGADGNLKPLVEIIRVLETAGASAGDMMALLGQRAGPGRQALVDQGSAALGDLTVNLEDSAGRAAEVAGVQMQGLAGAMRELKSALEAAAIAIAQSGLLQFVEDLARRLAAAIRQLADTNPALLRMATVLAAV